MGPDAQTVLELSPDGLAQLKNTVTGRDSSPQLAHSAPIDALAFSPDGTKLATWTRDRRVRLWSIPEGLPLATWATSDHPDRILFNQSQSVLATLGRQESAGQRERGYSSIRLWKLPDGRAMAAPVLPFNFMTWAAAFSPDGTILAISYRPDGTKPCEVVFWDTRTGEIRKLPVNDSHGFDGMSFGSDGKLVLLRSITKALIINVKTCQPNLANPIMPPTTPEVKTPDPALFAAGLFTPDGRTIAVGDSQGYAQLRSATTGRLLAPIFRHGTSVENIAISPDGQTALIVGGFTARLYDIPTGQPLAGKMELPQDLTKSGSLHRDVAFGDEGRIVTILSGHTVSVWDITQVRGGPRVIPHRTGPGPIAFSPDGKRLLAGSLVQPTARLWNTATGEPVGPLLVHDSPPSGGGFTRVHVAAFSPDGRIAITAGDDRYVRLWDPHTGRALGNPLPHPHWVVSAAFSPDSRKLMVGTASGSAVLWDLSGQPTIRKTIRGPGSQAEALGFSFDGQSALLKTAGFNPLLIETATGNVIRTLADDINSHQFAFLAGSESALSLSGGSLRRLDPRTGSSLGPLSGSSINAFSVDSNGHLVVTGGEDGSLRIWDPARGIAVGAAMAQRSPIRAVAISPDGRTVASVDQDGTIRFWNVANRRQIGLPVRLGLQATRLVFSPNGRALAANGDLVRLCDVPDLDRIVTGRADLWAQVRTGHQLDSGGGVIPLEQRSWGQLRGEVEKSGADREMLVADPSPDERDLDWHERSTRDREQQGFDDSSLWHLDRMIALRPDDAWLYARRARVRRSSGLDATADLGRFRDLASPAQHEAWDSEEAIRHEAAEDWPAALACYDRLVAAMPGDDWLCHRRAQVPRSSRSLAVSSRRAHPMRSTRV